MFFSSQEPGQDHETIPDREITVINLQKDKSKQNFKGFVDTDDIDDNLHQVEEHPEAEAPVPTPAPFVPTPLVSETPSSSSAAPETPAPETQPPSTPVPFVPTSIPSLVPNTETLNSDPVPDTVQPVEEETTHLSGNLPCKGNQSNTTELV